MNPFSFHIPTRVEIGEGCVAELGKLAQTLTAGKKVLFVTDSELCRLGLAETAMRSLSSAGFECTLFTRVKPNPRDTDCLEGAGLARKIRADLIVALGGGSVIDSAKAIALLQTHGDDLRKYVQRGTINRPVTPIIAIPTTAGTGSEVTRSAVITDTASSRKLTVKDIRLAPRLALVDPSLTYSLPPGLTASTGMDALVHAIEAYTCRLANPFSDLFALEAMKRIFPWLPVAVRDGANKAARQQMMIGSLFAGIAFSHADVAAVHCMAEAVGGLYDTPHGVANSIFLPVVSRLNAEAEPARYAECAKACGLDVEGLPAAEAAQVFVAELVKLSRLVGIPSFSDLPGVQSSDFELLAEMAYLNGSTPSNSRVIRKEDYLELFREAYRQK